MPIPVLIVTGFLGSGKTSFLRRLLPACGAAGLRPALIINEVGDVDVDGELLADLHAEQVKLVGGCVCCTLQARLKDTLFEVLEQERGDLVIIECSGLSNPVDVLHILTIPALLPRVAVTHLVCLVDVNRLAALLRATELAKTQIATADLVLLNKADRLAAGMEEEIERAVAALAPAAARQWTTYGDPGSERLRDLLTGPVPVRAWPLEHEHEHEHERGHTHALPASFCTVAVPLPAGLTLERVQGLLRDLPANVIRAKGFALVDGEWQTMHRVYDTVDIVPFGDAPSCGAVLVCIGQHLNETAIREQVLGMIPG